MRPRRWAQRASPIEKGPGGIGGRFIRDALTTRTAGAWLGCGMAEVVTGIVGICEVSVRAASEES
jgi:hypothetical protein